MGKKNNSNKITGFQNGEQPEIFGRSKTREEIKAERQEEKRKEQEALRQARAKAKAARKAAMAGKKRTDLIVLGVFLGVIVLAAAIALAVQMVRESKDQQYEPAPSMSQFWSTGTKPELSADGLTAVITRAYYTRGGYLCVHLNLGNGSDRPQHMASLNVELRNNDTKELIGGGYTDEIAPGYTVPAGGYNEYYFMISPEFVQIKDDPLSSLSYSITAEGYTDE